MQCVADGLFYRALLLVDEGGEETRACSGNGVDMRVPQVRAKMRNWAGASETKWASKGVLARHMFSPFSFFILFWISIQVQFQVFKIHLSLNFSTTIMILKLLEDIHKDITQLL